ncbi:MAG: glycosyltransferase family 39 protein [Pyrinomonadaceae bacterium]|nr:glycosyltransferase family 39 protein [Acidobacteriota bacterium]MBP7375571.1 glycosyltransferase family 39 protein [Pyrinomonadaceae bacterium]
MSKNRAISTTVIVGLAIAYIAARLWRLTASCLWFDEIFSVHAATHSWSSILSFVAQDLIHPPLFYFLLKLWIGIGGESVFWLRLLPVIFSAAALVPFLLLMREMKSGRSVTVLALFFIAFNGSLIKYAQEVRMYSLLMCVSLFSIWLFARYFIKGKSLVPLIIVNVLMVYSHYFGWFVVFSEVAAILLFQRIKIRAILLMFGSTLLAFLPWAIMVMSYARAGAEVGQNIGWMQKPMPANIVQLILSLVEPLYFATSNAVPYSIYKVSLPVLLILTAGATLFCVRWNRNKTSSDSEQLWMLVIFAGMPVFIAFAASWLLPHSIWGTRHLIVIFVPLAILLAIAVCEVEQKAVRIGVLSLLVLFTAYAVVLTAQRETAQYSWCAWDPLTVTSGLPANAAIYTGEDLVAYHLWFANRQLPERRIVRVDGLNGVKEDKAYFLPRGFESVQTVSIDELNEKQFWIAFRTKYWDPNAAFIDDLRVRGYNVGEAKIIDANSEQAVLVEFSKEK